MSPHACRCSALQAAAQSVKLQATYQGCAEAGICYPPITRTVAVLLPAAGAGTAGAQPGVAAAPIAAPAREEASGAPISEQDRLARTLLESPLWLSMGLFFGLGVLLAFTPCVFPMIPILSSIIVGQGSALTTRRAFTLSLVYVLAVAVTYTAAGVFAGLFGENLQAVFQNPWILTAFAAVFVLLALSMFGFYELQMPSALQSKLTEVSNRQRGGTLAGVAVMGLLSALIVGPCVAAPLAGALLVIGQTGDATLGGLALFSMSLGMGFPLLVIGTSAGKLLPRAGAWMDAVKAVFGVLLLAVAIWMLERILPPALSMTLWAVLLIVSGIYMGAMTQLRPDASGWSKLWKGLGLVGVIYGALLLAGASIGGGDLLQPLRGTLVAQGPGAGGDAGFERGLPFRQVKGVEGLDRALAAATGRPVMLDFYADWCVSCREMEKYTFSDPNVRQALSQTVLLQTDVTPNDPEDRALLKRFGLFGPPAILFFSPEGQERRAYRVVGFMEAPKFHAHVRQALGLASASAKDVTE